MQPSTRTHYLTIGVALFFLAFSLAVFAKPLTVRDDRGVVVVFDKPPQRVVSLLPSLTESVCALGKCSALVGVDRFSNWPKSIQGLPKLGGIGDINIERIVQLKPDVVLLEKASPVIARLNGLGIKTFALDIKSMGDEERALQKLDLVLGTSESARVWNQIQQEIMRARKQLTDKADNIRVYFEVNPAPFAAGSTSFIGEILARLSLINIIPESLGAFPKINPEFVVQAKPDVILLTESTVADIQKRPGWNSIPAVSNNRICVFTSEQNDVLVRPGPRMGEAALIISQCIQEKMSSSR
ncbi:MAG: ABC transporter substrate-binding protein [Polynucleobacter sp. 24-46-87]|uniref:ABC transporter substrate-binding protein n=1 Tax=unclassified Polynucleobacter TaxID=2640945 RepID=UPI000BD34B91|nr:MULTISPECIES: helical backbone metal receptor [unclassified Polynucleobacter]OYY13993.1 MAG: ABC transporter substrate-binding protein [Polynucleobacter sp. 35-46-11]OZA12967.1 MAG: ABC transporter substrate-binding protein [Polynucleobacter sp. 24-46-87]OZA73394.1 MAG: ABC transporter substrate-binding protein [Polynucleobacter sp. 39-46-10]